MDYSFSEIASVTQEAFYLLRQDAAMVTEENWTSENPPIEIAKAKRSVETAIHEVFDSYEWADASLSPEHPSAWTFKMRNALVYCLARELAIPLAGRIEDMKSYDALYREKLREARVNDLSTHLDQICDNFVLPFIFSTTIEDVSQRAQVRDSWKWKFGESILTRVNRRISAITVKTHYDIVNTGDQQISLAVIAYDKSAEEVNARRLLAVSKNTVVFKPNILVTWQFDDFSVPEGCYIECQPIRGATTFEALQENYRQHGWEYDKNINYSVHLSKAIAEQDAEDYGYFLGGSTSTRICPQVRFYSYETGATSLFTIAQRVMRRIFPFVLGNAEQPLPYSIRQFANTVNEAAVSAENAVKTILGVSALDSVSEQAAEMLATSNVAPVLGLDANFAKLRLEEYERLILEAQRTAINREISSTTDAAVRETLSQMLGSLKAGSKMSHGVGTLAKRVGDLATRARQEVLMAHRWNFATFTEEVGGAGNIVPSGKHLLAYPRHCLRLTSIIGYDDRAVEWRVVNGMIEADKPVRRMSYLKDVADLTRWSPIAANLYALKLKALATGQLLGDAQTAQMQEVQYQTALQDAKLRDARESNTPSDAWGENYYVNAMRGGKRDDPWR